MRRRALLACLVCAGAFAAREAYSHHSFAVFFQTDKTIAVTGVVTEFRFSNPHGLIRLDVTTENGGTFLGIYKLERDTLTVCLGDENDNDRPTEFASKEGTKVMLLVLQREKK